MKATIKRTIRGETLTLNKGNEVTILSDNLDEIVTIRTKEGVITYVLLEDLKFLQKTLKNRKMNTEKNKLIAEFMGLNKTKMFFNLKTGNYVKKENFETEVGAVEVYLKNNKPITSFKYHKDWNWLMQVVEKIENTQPISIIISCGNCEVYNCKTAETLFFFEGVKIEAVYNACVAFIEWHNKNK